jgi:hypothetical protein
MARHVILVVTNSKKYEWPGRRNILAGMHGIQYDTDNVDTSSKATMEEVDQHKALRNPPRLGRCARI